MAAKIFYRAISIIPKTRARVNRKRESYFLTAWSCDEREYGKNTKVAADVSAFSVRKIKKEQEPKAFFILALALCVLIYELDSRGGLKTVMKVYPYNLDAVD